MLLGSRNLEHGETAAKSIGTDSHALQLDVTNQTSIAAAAHRIRNEFGRLDVLVNNAGISHAGEPGRSLEEIVKSGRASIASLGEVRAVFETNVFGVVAITGGTHREHIECRRLADFELEPDEPAPLDVRHLLLVEDCAQRAHGRFRRRPRVGRHQGQGCAPRLHLCRTQ